MLRFFLIEKLKVMAVERKVVRSEMSISNIFCFRRECGPPVKPNYNLRFAVETHCMDEAQSHFQIYEGILLLLASIKAIFIVSFAVKESIR